MTEKEWIIILFRDFWISLVNDVPQYIYELLFGLFCIATILIFVCKGIKGGWRTVAQVALIEYIVLAYCSTLIFRTVNPEIEHHFRPFWSYGVIRANPNSMILPETIMNVIAFVPMGVLLGMTIRSIKWWKVLLAGSIMSISIEVLQFMTKRGVSEVDDVIHNALGCIIGYGAYLLSVKCIHTMYNEWK